MISKAAETQLIKWLFWGGIGVTILVTSSLSYDPVNVSKLLLLSGVGFSIAFQAISVGTTTLWQKYRVETMGAIGFLIAGIWTFINASNPKALAFFGTFGRNTGFLTYIALTFIFLGSLLLFSRDAMKKIVWSLLVAGWINVAYCLSAAAGFDPISWNNIYNRILGTFGNPNFIGAFLGMFFSAAVAFIIGKETTRNQKIALGITLPFACWEILESKAIQGLALSVTGTGLVIFFVIRGYLKKAMFQISYLILAMLGGSLALAGALQKGPLTSLIYKTSVSLRGEYWAAGLNMGFDHLLTGVGWDGYGEWFRRERRPSALILPGAETVTNAAHNVFIDIFSYGGLPLISTYLFIVCLSLIAALKVIGRTKHYDPVFVAIFTAWFCYNLQAVISINQIGLAIWGWILGGTLIAYEKTTRANHEQKESSGGAIKTSKKQRNHKSSQIGNYLAGVSGFAIGLIIALPPFLNDADYRSSLAAKDAKRVIANSTKWPIDSFRLTSNAILLENSKLTEEAYQLAKKAVEYNPNYFDSWRLLANISKSSPEEKKLAIEKMKFLDPLNTTIGK